MKKQREIMDVSLPVPEAADLTTKAAQAGVTTAEFLGIQVLAGAYGQTHPEVMAFRKRAKPGINGPKTQGAGDSDPPEGGCADGSRRKVR